MSGDPDGKTLLQFLMESAPEANPFLDPKALNTDADAEGRGGEIPEEDGESSRVARRIAELARLSRVDYDVFARMKQKRSASNCERSTRKFQVSVRRWRSIRR